MIMRRAELRNYHYIYKITRDDGKYYIGMHSTDDLEDSYFGSGKKITRSIKRHGIEKHSKEILEFLSSRKELKERERVLVNEELLSDPMCMNLALGGNFIWPTSVTPKARKKRSEALKEYYASEAGQATKARLSAVHTGRKCTEEAKAKMVVAAKDRMAKMHADGSWEAVKEKNAEAHRGKTHSPETIAKRAASVQAYKDENGGKRTFSKNARLNISRSLIGSARNVKTWILMAPDGVEILVTNLQQWVRDNQLKIVGRRVFDETGTKYRVRLAE
jgi:hypothetical protein